jgi:DDE superfamily endonuclease
MQYYAVTTCAKATGQRFPAWSTAPRPNCTLSLPMRTVTTACQLADLPVEVLGRLRSDRVLHFPVTPRRPGTNGRPPRHGPEFAVADPKTWPQPLVAITTDTTRYGTAAAQA